MKKAIIALLAFVSFLLVASPAEAATGVPVGTRINMITGTPTTVPAGTPFHVIHGWGLTPNLTVPGQADFVLDVNGVTQKGQLVNGGVGVNGVLVKLKLYNFNQGLPSGSYLLTGRWFLGCTDAVNGGFITGPCATPNAQVQVFTTSVTLTVP